MNDETLGILICEVESILNSRPLSSDLNNLEPITPNHLLLGRSEITFPLVYLRIQIFIRERDGVRFSIWPNYFGKDGKKNIWCCCNNDINGFFKEDRWRLVISFFSWIIFCPEITGQWEELLKYTKIVRIV